MPFQLLFTKTTKKLLPQLISQVTQASLDHPTCWVFKSQKDLDDFKSIFPKPFSLGKLFFTHQGLKEYFLQSSLSTKARSPLWLRNYIYHALLKTVLKKHGPKELQNIQNWLFYTKLFRNEGKSHQDMAYFLSSLRKTDVQIGKEIDSACKTFFSEYSFLLDDYEIHTQFLENSQSPFPAQTEFAFIDWPYIDASLKDTLEHLNKLHPHSEHWVLLQHDDEQNLQDSIIKQWPNLKESTIKKTKSININSHLAQYQLIESPTPFYSIHQIAQNIQNDLRDGIDQEEIFILNSSKSFINNLFLQLCFKKNIQLLNSQVFFNFPLIQKSTSLNCSKALDFLNTQIEKISWDQQETSEMNQYFYALTEWKKTLSSLLFLEQKIPLLAKNQPSDFLEDLSKQLKTPALLQNSIHFASAESLGLRLYKKIYALDSSKAHFEKPCPSILGRPLPLTSYQSFFQKKFFQNLLHSADHYEFHYSAIDEKGRPQSLSPWVEEIFQNRKQNLNSTFGLNLSDKKLETSQKIELARYQPNDPEFLLYQGKISDKSVLKQMKKKYASGISPTSLNDYEECPYRFLAKNFYGVKEEKESLLDFAHYELGNLSHQYLELFFKENQECINIAAKQLSIQNEIFDRLDKFHQSFSEKTLTDFPHIPSFNQKKALSKILKGITHYLNYFWKQQNQYDNFFEPYAFEVKFSFNLGQYLGLEDAFMISGRIDRIDVNPQKTEFIVIDYKSGNTQDTTIKTSTLKSFSLALYLLGAKQYLNFEKGLNAEAKGALLYSLGEAKFYPGLVQKEIAASFNLNRMKNGIYDEETWKEYWTEFNLKLKTNCTRILEGEFFVTPNPCIKHCPAQTVCRYPYHETA